MHSYKVTATISGGFPRSAHLFVGSKTPRTLIEWLRVFKITDNPVVKELNHVNFDDTYMYLEPYMTKLCQTLENLNLKFCIEFEYEEEQFYIGRPIESIESICKDTLLWKQYDITDIDIFAAIYNKEEFLCYSIDWKN